MLGCTAALAVTAAWYFYADLIYLETGLTQAVFRPSGTYPPEIAPGVEFVTVSHFSTAERLLSADYWKTMGDRLWSLYLTPVGTFAAIVGIGIACTRPKGWALHLWALAGVALVLVAAEGQFWHEFHTLPLVPPLVLYAGLALAPVFEPQPGLPRTASIVIVSAAVAVLSIQSFRASGVRDKLYRSQQPADAGFEEWGRAVRELTQVAPVITVDYFEGGANSPMMLYYAHRTGWSFDVHSISVEVIEHLVRTRGARYFVTAERFSAQEAHRIGFVHELCAAELLDAKVDELALAVAANGPQAVKACKRLVQDMAGEPITAALRDDTARRIADIRASDEGREGVRSFLEKRAPDWKA